MHRSLLSFVLLIVACGDDDALPVDAGTDAPRLPDAGRDAGPPQCTAPSECEDESFCDGVPTCDPASPFADDFGCVASTEPPCPEGFTCDEERDRCLSPCDVAGDVDEDTYVSEACGGADCDDTDPTIFPSATEACDEVDQDCDDVVDEDCVMAE